MEKTLKNATTTSKIASKIFLYADLDSKISSKKEAEAG